MARSWISHVPNNLCLSLVIKPDAVNVARLPLANLSQLLAVSACRALDACEVTTTLKWPNDIQLGGRKIAGVLAETVTKGSNFVGLVLGIGINVNLEAATLASIDQPATSLAVHLGHSISVSSLRDRLLGEFFGQYEEFIHAGFPLIRQEFISRCRFLGTEIAVRRASDALQGKASDINSDGALVLSEPDGKLHVVDIAEMLI